MNISDRITRSVSEHPIASIAMIALLYTLINLFSDGRIFWSLIAGIILFVGSYLVGRASVIKPD